MLLTMSVYMLHMQMADWSKGVIGSSETDVALLMGAYGIGLFALGPFISYWVQRYRRNEACIQAIILMLLVVGAIFLCQHRLLEWNVQPWVFGALRFMLGASFGLAQMVLCSTLIIDTCESFQRTEANHSVAWFGRFALSLGPVLAWVLMPQVDNKVFFLVVGGLIGASILLIRMVSFPFKAPEDNFHRFSLDRFFLPEGWLLFLNLAMITSIVGMVFAVERQPMFYGMMMGGFLLALLAERFAFANADLKSETLTGLIAMAAALLVHHAGRSMVAGLVPPVLIGFGIGIIGSRFLLFFIKLSRHCQRGTSQSTFFLGWEFGISVGFSVGLCCHEHVFALTLTLTVASLLLYNFVTHPWYMKHRNR